LMALVGERVQYTKQQRQVGPPRHRTADQQPEKHSIFGKMRALANQHVAHVNRRSGDSGNYPPHNRVDDLGGVDGGKRRGREGEDQRAPQNYRDPLAERSGLRSGRERFRSWHQLAVVSMSDARRGLQPEVMRRFWASSFFMKIGNVSDLSVIASSYQWSQAPRNSIRKDARWTIC